MGRKERPEALTSKRKQKTTEPVRRAACEADRKTVGSTEQFLDRDQWRADGNWHQYHQNFGYLTIYNVLSFDLFHSVLSS